MKNSLLLAAVAGLASVASADVVFTTSATGPAMAGSVFGARATGDTVDTGNFIFNAGGGTALNSAIHTIGGSDAMTNPLGRATTVSSTVSTSGNIRTVTFTWDTDGAVAMLQPGDLLGGAPITTLSFEMGSANAGPNGLNDPDFIAFDHAADPATPGTFLAAFNLLDAAGGSLFAGTWFVSNDAGGISGRTFVGAGGADLATFNIGGATATVRYIIPAPSAMALLGLGGLVATRRRR